MPQGCQDVTGRDSEEATQEASVKADVLKRYEDKINSLIEYIKKQDERFDKQEHFNRELKTGF
jgi:hypothetical protein